MRNLFFLLVFVSCGYKTTELPAGMTEGQLPGQGGIDFATVSAEVFQPHCIRCHGTAGGVNLSSYASVKAVIGRIAGAVNSGAMPPGNPLGAGPKNILNAWITAGAPENATGGTSGGTGGGTTGGTTGGTSPLSFASVKEVIFQPHCIRCHGNAGGVNLTTYSSVRASLNKIRNAVNSGFMPPAGPLTAEQKNFLNQWIAAGAPENAGGGTTTTGGGTSGGCDDDDDDDDCEYDDRLFGAGLVVPVSERWVFDIEKNIFRLIQDGHHDR